MTDKIYDYDFTPEQVLAEVHKLAEERPNFNYLGQPGTNLDGGMCSYLHARDYRSEGEGCIVGQALSRLGVTHFDLADMEGEAAGPTVARLLNVDYHKVQRYIPSLSELDRIQSLQDAGLPWGEAVRRESY